MSECEECGDMPADHYIEPDGTEVTLCSECVKRHIHVSTPNAYDFGDPDDWR